MSSALTLAGDGDGRQAVDVGCGAGVETAAVLRAGWTVRALDRDSDALAQLRETTPAGLQRALQTEVADLNELPCLPPADLIYAGYALPYVRPDRFDAMWARVLRGLRPGGWMAVNLFGDRDSWAGDPDETFLPEAAARALFVGLEVVQFDVEDADGVAFSGPKHWHVYDVIAKRPGPDVLGPHDPPAPL